MGINNRTKQGANFVPAYEVSGVPFVTSSAANEVVNEPVRIKFPYVTRFFVVQNTSQNWLRVGFSENGVTGTLGSKEANNYLLVSGNQVTSRLELRCKELWFAADAGTAPTSFSLIAGLTGIQNSEFPVLTGTLTGSNNNYQSPRFEGVG
ncbi:hypothetical protein CMI47_19035 [Candidatus Pacearchaeota archaeon]|nr:hypothetical protein [Candidatus Pacearchaeota archaeon]